MSRLVPFLVLASLAAPAFAQRLPTAPPAAAQVPVAPLSDGLAFIENRGQWPDEVLFLARTGGADIWVTADALVLDFYQTERETLTAPEDGEPEERGLEVTRRRGHVVAMRFEGGRAQRAVGHGRQETYHSYFLGSDPSRWASRVALYDEVVLEGLYPGVDLRLYEEEGLLRYDLVLAPGAALAEVRVRLDGADGVAVTEAGALRMETALGPVEQRELLAYQEEPGGQRAPVASAFALASDGAVAFAVEGADPARRLVLDPLLWSTFLGRAGFEYADAVAVGPDGSAIVAGRTASVSFPVTPGAYDTTFDGGDYDAFVTQLAPDGRSLRYSTFLGGDETDHALAVDVSPDGSATVVGETRSEDFPRMPGAFDTSYSGEFDAFVTRLAPDGASLTYSTFLGGAADDFAVAVDVGTDGAATVAGRTYNADFPTTPGAYDTSHDGDADVFVARLAPDGASLTYSTFLGGGLFDGAHAIVVEADGRVTLTGNTSSADFPTTPSAYDRSFNGVTDAFVARLTPDGGALAYSTFLGGSRYDSAFDVAVGADGGAAVAGRTFSRNFPTTPGAFDRSFNEGTWDAFVARFSPDDGSLIFSTYLGGHLGDSALGVVIGADESVIVAGQTKSTPYPTTIGAFDITDNKSQEAFLTRFTPDGAALLYSTYFGAPSNEYAHAIALGPDGAITLAGETRSTGFPTTPGAYDTSFNGDYDAFVARLRPEPTLWLTATVFDHHVARGDPFRFQVALTNLTPEPLTGDLFLQVRREGPYFFTQQILDAASLPPGRAAPTFAFTFTFTVPDRAPLGAYFARLMMFTPGGVALGTTDFRFTVVSRGDAMAGDEDLAVLAEGFGAVRVLDAGGLAGAPAPAAAVVPEAMAAVWPNPASAEAAARFSLAAPSDVHLALYDVLGRAVLTVDAGRLGAGGHRLDLDVSKLPAGVYVWRLSAGDRAEAGRLTVTR